MARHTPLYDEHIRLGAKMVEFAGWEMPVQYTGVIAEHKAVRAAAGLFDVSHMGEIEISGPDAGAAAQYLTTNDIKTMIDGKAQYSLLCNERGTVVDDIIVYRFSKTRYMLVVNASNTEKDLAWCRSHMKGNSAVIDRSDEYALIALQGPRSAEILSRLVDLDLNSVAKYHFQTGRVADAGGCVVARTGYTGEDGFELFVAPSRAAAVWQALLESGRPSGALPAGLGARDTLRMEMKYSLYGHEIDEERTPLESGLAWVVKLDAPDDFIGREALAAAKKQGVSRRLVGFKMTEPGIPRQGYAVLIDGKPAGMVTSGTMSPSLRIAIGIGLVPADAANVGNKIFIDIRGNERQAEIVKTPFYKKK